MAEITLAIIFGLASLYYIFSSGYWFAWEKQGRFDRPISYDEAMRVLFRNPHA